MEGTPAEASSAKTQVEACLGRILVEDCSATLEGVCLDRTRGVECSAKTLVEECSVDRTPAVDFLVAATQVVVSSEVLLILAADSSEATLGEACSAEILEAACLEQTLEAACSKLCRGASKRSTGSLCGVLVVEPPQQEYKVTESE